MRVVCCYVEGKLHPLTLAALQKYAPDADLVDLGLAWDAYYLFLAQLWEEGEGFLIVEEDIELHADVIPQLEACPEPWCLFGFPGAGGALLRGSLGCTRFSTELLVAHPDLMAKLPVRDWKRLDSEILPALTKLGYTQHIHEPPVPHHHYRPERRLCDCGATEH